MKRFLRAGEGYALSGHKFKYLKLLYISLLTFFMCFIAGPSRAAGADTVSTDIKPLQIGDTIPEALWHLPLQVVNHPEGKETINLADYRDKKLIILDFWATWCKPCLESLYRLGAIRDSAFRDELAVIPVQAFDSRRRAVAFMERHEWSRYSVVDDPALHDKVFSRYLTGFGTVWISEGKLYAVPQYADITAQNIARVIQGHTVHMDNQPEQPISNP